MKIETNYKLVLSHEEAVFLAQILDKAFDNVTLKPSAEVKASFEDLLDNLPSISTEKEAD